MKNQPSDQEIFSVLSSIIIEALRVDRSEFNLDTRLFLDLSAESIDILDIRFRIEKAFGFKIQDQEIVRSLGEGLNQQQTLEKFTVASLVQFIHGKLTIKETIS